ncbi:MAG: DUF4358 domain-containing protein [Ruminococcus sp.]|nr:DUF4358 domain-containing protein [Ruminococcus sp.]
MKKTKILCAVLALTLAASMSLTACGDNSSDDSGEAPAETTAANAGEGDGGEQTNDPDEARLAANYYADDLFNGIEYVDQLAEIAPEMVEKLYGISPDKYTTGKVYVGGVATTEEIACFDAVEETAAGEIKTALENRIVAQMKAVEDYNPDELVKLNDPVLITHGNSVYMCLSNDNDKAKEIIG